MNLTTISLNISVRIVELSCGNRLVNRRLHDLGVMEGTDVSVKRRFPFGGPITLEAGGQWISIRRREARQILVEAI